MKTTTVRYPLEGYLGKGIQNSDEPIALFLACREVDCEDARWVQCQLLAEPIMTCGGLATNDDGTIKHRYWLIVAPLVHDEASTIYRRCPIDMVFYVGVVTWEEVLRDYYAQLTSNS